MLDDPTEVIGAALIKLGYGLNSGVPAELEQARAESIRVKQRLRAFLNAEAREQLIAGDLLAAQAGEITAQGAINGNPALRFVYPSEGFALYADNAVILRESAAARRTRVPQLPSSPGRLGSHSVNEFHGHGERSSLEAAAGIDAIQCNAVPRTGAAFARTMVRAAPGRDTAIA